MVASLRKFLLFQKWAGALAFMLWADLCLGELKAQCALACQQLVQVSLDQSGEAEVTVGLIAPYAAATCGGTFEVTLFNLQNQPVPNNMLDCSMLDQTLSVRVRHFPTGNICFGSVVPKDYLPPQFSCPEKVVACNADTAAAVVGFPSVADNCTPLQINQLFRTDKKIDLPCTTQHNGLFVTARIERTWVAADQQGNIGTCLQKIWMRRTALSDVIFPKNRDNFQMPSLDCSQNPNDLALTGQPTVEGRNIIAGGDCELVVGFSDQVSNTCGTSGRQVLRSWTVSDYCANTFSIHVQVIKVEDKTPPQFSPPADLTVSTSPTNCTAVVNLPQISGGSDDCSTFSITPRWQFGTGFGPFSGVPMGDHVVEYIATDACGNSSQKTMQLTVEDHMPPTAVCKPTMLLSLASQGTTFLNANSVDNGSNDNCQLTSIQISRDGVNFQSNIQLDCSDVGKTVGIILRVRDFWGNENTCHSSVVAQDNLKPTIQCPASKTLNCSENLENTQFTGHPLVSDNCSSPTVQYSDVKNLNACGVGTVQRIWQATDVAGNSVTCSQILTVQNLPIIAVQFPSDFTVTACASLDDLKPQRTGLPSVTGQSCQTPTISHADEVLSAPQGCFNILRKWKVIDWCHYQTGIPNSLGVWEHTQLIKVFDQTAPQLTVPADLTISANLAGCKAQVLLPDASASDCSDQISISNNSTFALDKKANASGQYPAGEHLVIFSATDGCGNTATEVMKIKVLPCGAGTFEVRGTIRNEKNVPIADPQVFLTADGVKLEDECDASGSFRLEDVPGGVTYRLTPENRLGNWLNGVTTFDLLLISRHILGVTTLDSPYKMIAADVNKSNSITANDIVQLRKLILGIFDTMPGNTSWRFVPANHAFSDPKNPWAGGGFPEHLLLNTLSENKNAQDFVGIKIGDLNINANTTKTRSPSDTIYIGIENARLRAGYPTYVDVKLGRWQALEGFQFELQFDTAQIERLELEFSDKKILEARHVGQFSDGKLAVSWDEVFSNRPMEGDSLLFRLHFLAKNDVETKDIFKIQENRMPAEAYLPQKETAAVIQLQNSGQKNRRGNFQLLPNHPNPFSETTTIRVEMPVPTETTLLVSDVLGRVVIEKKYRLARGWNDIEIHAGQLPHPGVYSFWLKSLDAPPASGKIIFSKD